MRALRKHQREIVAIGRAIASGQPVESILAWVVPGGGKSWLPLLLAEEMPDMKLGWFVPRTALRDQAERDALEHFGLTIRGTANALNPSRGSRGFVTTHQALAENPDIWAHESQRHRYIYVFDELHHAKCSRGQEPNGNAKALDRLKPALWLFMTGTLDTNDSSYIHRVNYEQNGAGMVPSPESSADRYVRYTRADAMGDNALVPVEFHHHDGPVKWHDLDTSEPNGGVLSETARADEAKAIYTVLSTRAADQLRDNCLDHWRVHGRKMLVVLHSQAAAKKRHTFFANQGINSFLAITDNDDARDDIKRFKATSNGVLVTCAMAYEGLDDRDITHIACLTHIRSVPWIEQMVGRAWRASQGKECCWVFCPDDPRMNRTIKRIHEEQPAANVHRDTEGPGSNGNGNGRGVLALDGAVDAVFQRHLDGTVASNEHQRQWAAFAKKCAISEADPLFQQVMTRLQQPARVAQPLTISEQEMQIREQLSTLCRRINIANGDKWGSVEHRVFKAMDNKKVKDMTLDELRRAYAIANQYAG